MPLQLSASEKAGLDRFETQIETGFTSGAEQPPATQVVLPLTNYDRPMIIPLPNGTTQDVTVAMKPVVKAPFKIVVASLLKAMWEDYITPSFSASWRQWPDASMAQCGYRRSIWGNVRLRGLFSAPAAASGTTLFTLPAGYRPSGTLIFAVTAMDGYATIEIRSDGTVRQRSGPDGNSPVTDTVWYSLSGITFEAEA